MSASRLPDLGKNARFAGVTTTAELLARGLTDARIRGLVRRGRLVVVRRGLYARPDLVVPEGSAVTRTERLVSIAAAVAKYGPHAAASHQDAAFIHRLAILDGPDPGVIVVSRPPGGSRTGRPGVRLHQVTLLPRHVCVRDGIPVTTVARTVIDIARTTPFSSGVVTADSALFTKQTSVAKLSAIMWDCDRWPGITRARQVVSFSDARAESAFESLARVAFRDGGLPRPLLQVWVSGATRTIGRVDFLWDEQRTIAEADGAAKYQDPDRARKQLWRDAELRRAGYEVVHFTWAELASDPDQVIRSIKMAFARAARLRDRAG